MTASWGPGANTDDAGASITNAAKSSAQNYAQNPRFASNPVMNTLVYSPDVQIIISSGGKQYDVSRDIISGGVSRRENTCSSLAFTLANKDLRYNDRFRPMDRVVCFLKRIHWTQVFAGYLDSAPHVELYGGTVDFRASCTLKRLLHTWWDPGLADSQILFDQRLRDGATDSGIGLLLQDLLIEVGGWKRQNIHIQEFPMSFLLFMQEAVKKQQNHNQEQVQKFRDLLLGSGSTTTAPGAAASKQYDTTRGAFSLGQQFYITEMVAATDTLNMGPLAMDSSNAAAVTAAAAQSSDERDAKAWEAVAQAGVQWNQAAKDSDAAILLLACSMLETNPGPRMLANPNVPESMNFPFDGTGTDHDSVGLYQQRSIGWGTIAQRMNARESSMMFLNALSKLQDWRNMDPAAAIARVQIGPPASAYAPYVPIAKKFIQALRSASNTGSTIAGAVVGGAAGSAVTQAGAGITSSMPSLGLNVPGPGGTLAPSRIPKAVGSEFSPENTNPALNNPIAPSLPISNQGPLGPIEGTPVGALQQSGITGYKGPDTAGAISYAMSQVGLPYLATSVTGVGHDCSGLVMNAYKAIGLNIGRTTWDHYARGTKIPASAIQPGDVVQPNDGHEFMWAGNNMIIESSSPGKPIAVRPNYVNLNSAYAILHFPPAEFHGNPAFLPPESVGPGNVPGTGMQTGGVSEPIAQNLFSYQFEYGRFQSDVSDLFDGEKAFINDQPLIQMVQAMSKAGLRTFASAPNGDFVAYYPDYFGLDGKIAVWNLEDIEMKDVKLNLSDDSLATHVYVAGDNTGMGESQGVEGWLSTAGVATVENTWLFNMLRRVAPGLAMEGLTAESIMRKFGARPLVQELTALKAKELEFLAACKIFMEKWAGQYQTQVSFCFMPEIFPGMRINLVGHNLQVYVTQVDHHFDFQNGFSTSAVIMAPSTPNVGKLMNIPGNQSNQRPNNSTSDEPYNPQYFF